MLPLEWPAPPDPHPIRYLLPSGCRFPLSNATSRQVIVEKRDSRHWSGRNAHGNVIMPWRDGQGSMGADQLFHTYSLVLTSRFACGEYVRSIF